MRITIKDVAKEAECSITTVSLVLNNKGSNIPEKTRKRIVEIAQQLGYRPNQLAVSMVTGKSNIMGLIIPDNSNMFFSELSKAIEMEAIDHGYNLIYGNTNNEKNRDFAYLKLFVDRQVDGVIIAKSSSLSVSEEIENLQFLKKQNVPYVVVDRSYHDQSEYTICVDNFAGGYLAAKHLLDLGHSRIGCLTGPIHLMNSTDRLEGVRKAFQDFGIPFDEDLVFEGNYQFDLTEDALSFFLKQNVSAVFSFNDMMAFGLYRAAMRLGIQIPDDISIVGYDDVSFCDVVYPGLTTIHQPIADIGSDSVKQLIAMIENRSQMGESKAVLMQPTLKLRGSTKQKE